MPGLLTQGECTQSESGFHEWGPRFDTDEGPMEQCLACSMFRRVE